MNTKKTFKIYNSNDDNKIRLFIFPFAGGGASAFKDWQYFLSSKIEICVMQLPGREDRFFEKPYTNINDVIQEFHEGFNKLSELPFVFFGHSMGALFCYELSRYFESKSLPLPLHVFLSGSHPDGVKTDEKYSEMDESEMIDKIKAFNGIPSEIINNKDLLRLFLPAIRTDMTFLETYEKEFDYQFSMPITVFGGDSDPVVPVNELKKWDDFSKEFCKIVVVPGDHFFIFSEKETILSEISNNLKYLIYS